MIRVYFQSSTHAELVAIFENEDTYMACLHVLEKSAVDARMIVTDSEVDASLTDLEDQRTELQH